MIKKIFNKIPSNIVIGLWKKKIPKCIRKNIVWSLNDKFLVAIIGIIKNDKNEILVLRHTYRSEEWGLVSGWMEYGQPFKELLREVKEETGFIIECSSIVDVRFETEPNRIDIYISADFNSGSFICNSEISDFKFVEFGDWPDGMSSVQIKTLKEFHENKML